MDAAMDARFAQLARYASSSGVEGILFTCSAFGSSIEKVKAEHPNMPVLKPNEAMMEQAVRIGGKIGVLSVFEPTVPSIVRELADTAESAGRSGDMDVTARYVPGALDILHSGNEDAYNKAVAAAAANLNEELGGCDAMVLAMFSMACCGPEVSAVLGPKVQTLTSPNSAVEKMRMLVENK